MCFYNGAIEPRVFQVNSEASMCLVRIKNMGEVKGSIGVAQRSCTYRNFNMSRIIITVVIISLSFLITGYLSLGTSPL